MSTADPPSETALHEHAGLSADDLRRIYYFMQLTRSIEDRVRSLYLQGRLLGAVYSSRGQEGTAVASAYALQDGDLVAPLIRDLGASLTRGVEPRYIFAQWLGRSGGLSAGRDGNLHFSDIGHGVLPPISMLGAAIPLCAGIGLATLQQGTRRVALTYIGDGGTNTGDFHEGLNFASVLRLPLVLIVEDNGFAYSTPVARHVAISTFAQRGASYGIPATTVDGNDVLEVYRATRSAVERARDGAGPSLIEVKTFRMRGHAEHDDAAYVSKDLLAEWELRDPIRHLAAYAEECEALDASGRAEIDDRIALEVEEALAWAERSPLPEGGSQADGVYATAL